MPTSTVTETLTVSAHAIHAIDLSKRAALQSVRSWSAIAESAFPPGWGDPWTLVAAGLESAESYVTAQTAYALGIVDATANAFSVSLASRGIVDTPAVITPAVVRKATPVPAATDPKPAPAIAVHKDAPAATEPRGARAAQPKAGAPGSPKVQKAAAPVPAKTSAKTASRAPKGGSAKGASRRPPSAG